MLETREIQVGYYKDIHILQGVSVRARKRQITAVLGPNGVGKSTLLKTIYGFLAPSGGKIYLRGEDITGVPPYETAKKGIAYIPQHQNVFPFMSVEENLLLGAWIFKSDTQRIRQRIGENYVRSPVLKEKRKVAAGTLSGGQQRMVEIGRALMTDPEVLLIDEPTAGLAPKVAREMYAVLHTLRDEGRTILLVDQNIRQAVEIADYIYVLELGKNKVDGPRAQFDDLKKTLWL